MNHFHIKSSKGFSVPFSILCQATVGNGKDMNKHSRCESRMEPESGFFSSQRNGSAQKYIKTRLRYHSQTRAALSRYRQSAYEGMLYTTTAISPLLANPEDKNEDSDLAFIGQIQGPPEKVEEIVKALNGRSIGGMNTRGYGRIRCEDGNTRMPSLEDRLASFNDHIKELWQDMKRISSNSLAIPEEPEAIYFSLDLLAPAIFRDKNGLPSLAPTLDMQDQALKPIFWVTRPDFAGGWSGAWGLPKETSLAAKMGSSYVFCWNGSEDDLLSVLERIESEKIGERRDEGYGECLACHPFHEEVNER